MNLHPRHLVSATALAAAVLALPASAVTLVGLTADGRIAAFDSATPSSAATVSITGLMAGDSLVGIDVRPANNTIYGVSLSNRIYTLDKATGAATMVAALDVPVVNADLSYGVDFNPSADFAGGSSLRLVSSAGSNFAINSVTGVVGNAASNIGTGITSVAYSNSKPNPMAAPTSTQLYYVDSTRDVLRVATAAFNAPVINDVGPLGLDVADIGGFDLSAGGMGYGAFGMAGSSTTGIYGVDIATGATALLGTYDGKLTGLTIAPVPEPATYALMLAGLLAVGMAGRARRTRRAR